MLNRPLLLALSLSLTLGCEDRKAVVAHDAGPSEPSPNASILPAPLASTVESTTGAKLEDAGHPIVDAGADAAPPEPHALREDQALPLDAPHESTGLSLSARLRWVDTSGPGPRLPETNVDGLQRARDAQTFDVVVDLAGGRMRFAFASRSFTLPAGSELHARDDLYGHALLWPNRTTYTVLAPGTLRSVLSQQRADIVPLVRAKSLGLPAASLFGLFTERAELSTPTGKLELEQVRAPSPLAPSMIWASGSSLCQLLLELLGASPISSACRPELVPVRAMYTWPNGEHFSFEVSRLTRRSDLNPSALAMPPASTEFRPSELPPPPPSALLGDSELTELRLRAVARVERAEPSAPKTGLFVANHGESLRYISIDGAPAARLAPGAEQLLLGLRAGKYQLSARDFFGAEDAVLKSVEVPARFTLGDDAEKSH